jgi:hypothetical protein
MVVNTTGRCATTGLNSLSSSGGPAAAGAAHGCRPAGFLMRVAQDVAEVAHTSVPLFRATATPSGIVCCAPTHSVRPTLSQAWRLYALRWAARFEAPEWTAARSPPSALARAAAWRLFAQPNSLV